MSTPASAQQPAWSPPRDSVDEPTLKVYNSLTRTKVSTRGDWEGAPVCRMGGLMTCRRICRQSLSLATGGMSNGTIAALLYTMHHTWAMPGDPNPLLLLNTPELLT